MQSLQLSLRRYLWLALLLILTVCWHSQSQAASNAQCSHSLRVGQKLVVEGDGATQAAALLNSHHRWELVGQTRAQQRWRWKGMQPRTAVLHLRQGRVHRICQSTG